VAFVRQARESQHEQILALAKRLKAAKETKG
jgi:hypothetical protein